MSVDSKLAYMGYEDAVSARAGVVMVYSVGRKHKLKCKNKRGQDVDALSALARMLITSV